MKLDVSAGFYLFQQLAGDLPASHIVVIQDSGGRVGTLAGKGKLTALMSEIHPIADQLVNDMGRAVDHHRYGLWVILVMAGFHGILVIAFIVLRTLQHTDTALGQEGIAVFSLILGNHDNSQILGQLKGTEQTCRSGSDDNNIGMILHFHTLPYCANSCIFLREQDACTRSFSSISIVLSKVSRVRRIFSKVFFFIFSQIQRSSTI